MRLFLAILIPAEVRDALTIAQGELPRLGIFKVVEHVNLHLSLKFLGEVDEDRVNAVEEALEPVEHARFRVCVRGVGVFPNPARARVIWAGVAEGASEVTGLQGKVDAALKVHGYKPDSRYHPHVTLARAKGEVDKAGLQDFLKQKAELDIGAFNVSSYTLMRSRLTPTGPLYSIVREFHLG